MLWSWMRRPGWRVRRAVRSGSDSRFARVGFLGLGWVVVAVGGAVVEGVVVLDRAAAGFESLVSESCVDLCCLKQRMEQLAGPGYSVVLGVLRGAEATHYRSWQEGHLYLDGWVSHTPHVEAMGAELDQQKWAVWVLVLVLVFILVLE